MRKLRYRIGRRYAIHNHPLAQSKAAYPQGRRLTSEQEEIIRNMFQHSITYYTTERAIFHWHCK